MKPALAAVAIALLFAVQAFAHDNEQHVMGKVTKISDNSITVETLAKQ